VHRRTRIRRAAEALETVGLGPRRTHRPNQLSGGERQRVAIARALVADPAIVLADEPTGNLDSANGEAVVELLHELHRTGRTIVLITHDRDIAATAPRMVTMHDGRIVSDTGQPHIAPPPPTPLAPDAGTEMDAILAGPRARPPQEVSPSRSVGGDVEVVE
jgi:putative ABC transport system ATP-binding protein